MDFPFGAIIVLILSIGFFCLLTGWRGALFLGSIAGGIISLVCEESTMFLICLIVRKYDFIKKINVNACRNRCHMLC